MLHSDDPANLKRLFDVPTLFYLAGMMFVIGLQIMLYVAGKPDLLSLIETALLPHTRYS